MRTKKNPIRSVITDDDEGKFTEVCAVAGARFGVCVCVRGMVLFIV